MIKTFRGLIVDGGQDTIPLHTSDGSTGYRIVKFEIMSNDPLANDTESVMKIFTIAGTAISGTIDFNDTTLVAAAFRSSPSVITENGYSAIIFDQVVFNQDIFITHVDIHGSEACNYYIELEQIRLSDNENTVATLKDIRANV